VAEEEAVEHPHPLSLVGMGPPVEAALPVTMARVIPVGSVLRDLMVDQELVPEQKLLDVAEEAVVRVKPALME
jgi:hypothetical protein